MVEGPFNIQQVEQSVPAAIINYANAIPGPVQAFYGGYSKTAHKKQNRAWAHPREKGEDGKWRCTMDTDQRKMMGRVLTEARFLANPDPNVRGNGS